MSRDSSEEAGIDRSEEVGLDEGARLARLLAAGRVLFSELQLDAVLERVLAEARALTGARYAALGVLNEDRTELERFLTHGIDSAARAAIGSLPRGRGVLGILINDPRPLRLADVGQHPESYGFPPGHPPMRTFLGVPIMVRGRAWGNLYLTEKAGGEFTESDEEAIVLLAGWAGVAIENARLHEASERRRVALEHAVRALEAGRDIAAAIGSVAELEQVLQLVVKRGRALVGARTLLILLREGEHLVVAAHAGYGRGALGRRLPLADSTAGEVLRSGQARRIDDAPHQLRIPPARLGVPGARTALLVPMLHRGMAIGVLVAFDHGGAANAFSEEDKQLLESFAQSAANAVAMKRSVERDRLRAAIAASDAERARWARELHDQTLQALGGVRVLLASSLARGDAGAREEAMRQAVSDIELEIANLREIINDLRPAALDELGLASAIESLLERRRRERLRIDARLKLPGGGGRDSGLPPELETTVYRIVQEALTNIVKHARASAARVEVAHRDGELRIEVSDDGVGFDPRARTNGFGLAGMRERVALAGGELELTSGEGGTCVRVRLPLASSGARIIPLRADRIPAAPG